ncbi:hypothetical protein CEXT_202091 [Caerostris extrusa]|uniref:Uncharacterized protein n=1 Tax=Caerostris extrusa TaxID=172846 RepID=A0AAV4T7Y4_CAEEX|nr:hypothetical protein CEXT_202091 [Caerostris extrusa]
MKTSPFPKSNATQRCQPTDFDILQFRFPSPANRSDQTIRKTATVTSMAATSENPILAAPLSTRGHQQGTHSGDIELGREK